MGAPGSRAAARAPRRMPAPPPSPPAARRLGVPGSGPATLATAAPRPAAASPPRAPGGGRRSARRRACCGRRAGAQPRGGVAAPPCLGFPGLGRERGRRVPGAGRARLGSGSAARRSGPHVTGGGAAFSRHRPGGGSCGGRRVRGWGRRAGGGTAPGTALRGVVVPAVDVGLRGSRCGFACAWLFVGPQSLRISFSCSLMRRICRLPLLILYLLSCHSPCIHAVVELAELGGPGYRQRS